MDSAAKGINFLPTMGGVYFARSPCLKCTKIGATLRDSAVPRLYELSRYVKEPFVLIGWIESATPFRREAQAHAHFDAEQILNMGAGTEFFNIYEGVVEEYCSTQGAGGMGA